MDHEIDLTPEAYARQWETSGLWDTLFTTDATLTMAPEDPGLGAGPGIAHGPLRLMQTDVQSTSPELMITGTLGEGGMGLIKLARQVALERDVAVKTLRTHEGLDARAATLLLSEACITGLLEHPNIVPIYTLGQGEEGEPLIVMKRIEGRSWRELLDTPELVDTSEHGDLLGWHVHVLMQVCNAIHYAHSRGILHRDLKPDNVMVGEFGEICVLDWGIAVSLDDRYGDRFPRARDVKSPEGTPMYMAPEMAAGKGAHLGIETDVYLLGAILHELITGQPPHQGQTVLQVLFAAFRADVPVFDGSIPLDLGQICQKAMDPDPALRFPTVEAFRRALVDFLRHRESTELTRQASERRRYLEECLEHHGEDNDLSLDIHRAFVESRFGFEQALRLWTDNERARNEKRQLLLCMCDFELRLENVTAAAALLSELNQPDPALAARLDALSKEIASREDELTSLRRAHQDNDINVGARVRGSIIALFGLAMLLPLLPRLIPGLEGLVIDLNHRVYLTLLIPYALLLGVITAIGRKSILSNRANRYTFAALYITFGTVCLQRLQVWWTREDPAIALNNELLFYGLGIALLALNVDRRLMWASLPFWLGFLFGLGQPEWALEIFGVASAIGLLTTATLWLMPFGELRRTNEPDPSGD